MLPLPCCKRRSERLCLYPGTTLPSTDAVLVLPLRAPSLRELRALTLLSQMFRAGRLCQHFLWWGIIFPDFLPIGLFRVLGVFQHHWRFFLYSLLFLVDFRQERWQTVFILLVYTGNCFLPAWPLITSFLSATCIIFLLLQPLFSVAVEKSWPEFFS